jgi:hypothetical protein
MVERMVKTEEEWKNQLTPEQYEICKRNGTEPLFQVSMLIPRIREYTGAYAVIMNCSIQMTSSILELVGLVSRNQSKMKILKSSQI